MIRSWSILWDQWREFKEMLYMHKYAEQNKCLHAQHEIVWHLTCPGDCSPQIVCSQCQKYLGEPNTIDERRTVEMMRQTFLATFSG